MKVTQMPPSTHSEPGGNQWQHSIRGWRNCHAVVVCECMNNLTAHFTVCVITYPCGDYSKSMFVKDDIDIW